jgi:hypothetical protein
MFDTFVMVTLPLASEICRCVSCRLRLVFAAAWSPSRPGLLFLATCAGSLHVWDLLDRSHEPSLKISTTRCAITSISFSNALSKHATHSSNALLRASDAGSAIGDGASTSRSSAGGLAEPGQQQQQHRHVAAGAGLQVLAVGDAYGVLHLFELPRTLRRPLPNEYKLMAGFVAREAARVADVAARQVSIGAYARERQSRRRHVCKQTALCSAEGNRLGAGGLYHAGLCHE